MEKLRKGILGLLFCGTLLLNGCVGNEESKREEKILEERETGFVSVRKDEEISILSKGEVCAGEYELNGVFGENDILIGNDKLKIVRVNGNNTIVSIAKKNGVIKKGEKIFSVKRKENISLIEKEAVTENELENKNYKKTKAVLSEVLLGDFNNDGIVDITDFGVFNNCYGSVSGDSKYNIKCDIGPAAKGTSAGWSDICSICNIDGKIDILDLAVFSSNYMKVNPDNYVVRIGGNNRSHATQIIESIENGITYYIVIGWTESTNLKKYSTDSDTAILPNHGLGDIYIAKLDSNRKLVWQNIIGGEKPDVAKSVIKINNEYLVACNTLSSKITTEIGTIEFTNTKPWVYYVHLDMNGNITGQAPSKYISGRWVSKIIKTSETEFISVGSGERNDNTDPREVGIIEKMTNSFTPIKTLVLTRWNIGGFVTDNMNLFPHSNSFSGITKINNDNSYIVVGNMSNNETGKHSVVIMKIKDNLDIIELKAGKPYIFFDDYMSQYSSDVIEDTSLNNKGGFIICGNGSNDNKNYGFTAKISNLGMTLSSSLDGSVECGFGSAALTYDNKIISVGSCNSSDNKNNYFSRINGMNFDINKRAGFNGGNSSIIKMEQSNNFMVAGYSVNIALNREEIYIYKVDPDLNFLK